MKGHISKGIATSIVSTMLLSTLSVGLAQAATITNGSLKFGDVPNSNPYYSAILWLTENGVIQGYGDGTFRPNNPVNRAEMLKMIFLADGNEKNADSADLSKLFPDTPRSEWYAKYVALARQRGTVQGYPDGNFRPGDNINKVEAYKVVLKEYYNETTMNYAVTHSTIPNNGTIASDVKKTDWFAVYINFAALKNFYNAGEYTTTKNGNPFYPGQDLTRGELAQLIYRAKAVSDNFPNNIEDTASTYSSSIIPFNTSLYSYNFIESSGLPTGFTITDPNHPNATFGYATKYPQSLLTSNGDTANTLNFFEGSKPDVLSISVVVKENPDKLSLEDFYAKQPLNYFEHSVSHESLLVNSTPAVWFHKASKDASSIDEVVVVQFNNAVAEIVAHNSTHQEDGVFNYIVHNFWFKNFAV